MHCVSVNVPMGKSSLMLKKKAHERNFQYKYQLAVHRNLEYVYSVQHVNEQQAVL